MTKDELLAEQKAGAAARAIGESYISNPHYRPEVMPGQTGESIREWERRALAWELGWRMEDLLDD